MQKKRRKKLRKLISFLPELFAIAYLIAYGIADNLYYATPHLADLAEIGLTTKGYWTQNNRYGESYVPTDIPLKPWFRTDPPPENSFGSIEWRPDNTRPLYPIIEDRLGGALLGIIPVVAKYTFKFFRWHKQQRPKTP